MTERLTTLLRDEAQELDIPAPPAAAVLSTGRRLRRRGRLGTGAGAAAVIAVAAAGGLYAVDSLGDGTTTGAPAATSPGDLAFSVGRDVHLGAAGSPVVTLDEDVHSLHYTSEGVVVRSNRNGGASDGSGPEHFTLIEPDGTTSELDLTTEDIVVSTDLDQPYLAYSDLDEGTAQVVLHDVARDKEVARIDLPGRYEADGWPSPPVWLDGATVYVGFGGETLAVDWATGDVTRAGHLDGLMPVVLGGRTTAYPGGQAQVIDAATGEVLLSSDADGARWVLAPDGRHAYLMSDMGDGKSFDVYDLSTGEKATVDRSPDDFGWTADGDLFRLEGEQLVVCSADTGACRTDPSGVNAGEARAPGEPEQGVISVCDENGECREMETEAERQPLPVRTGGRIYES